MKITYQGILTALFYLNLTTLQDRLDHFHLIGGKVEPDKARGSAYISQARPAFFWARWIIVPTCHLWRGIWEETRVPALMHMDIHVSGWHELGKSRASEPRRWGS